MVHGTGTSSIAEHRSARQLILHRISEMVSMYICMYPSCLGMQLFRATCKRMCTCISVTLGMSLPKQTAKSRCLRRPTPTVGFPYVSSRLHDSSQLYQDLFTEGIIRGAYDAAGFLHVLREAIYCIIGYIIILSCDFHVEKMAVHDINTIQVNNLGTGFF